MNSFNGISDNFVIVIQNGELIHRVKEEADKTPTLETQKKMMIVAAKRLSVNPTEEYQAYADCLLTRYGNNPAIAREAGLLTSVVNKKSDNFGVSTKSQAEKRAFDLCVGGIQSVVANFFTIGE